MTGRRGGACAATSPPTWERYGIDEVAGWAFEVWNEPNLDVFWTGSQRDYLRLYEEVARPSRRSTRGCASGVTPTHFAPVNDSVFGAPFVLRGVKAAIGTADALSYWVISDQFEERGRPPALFHGGFGLLTVGNLRKPRFWALDLLDRLGRLGPERLAVAAAGDGAGGLVDALAASGPGGAVALLMWNGTLDQGKVDGDRLLDRQVTVRVRGLAPGRCRHTLYRVDAGHGNIVAEWRELGAPDWPDPEGWRALHAADRLDPAEPPRELPAPSGELELELGLPMPGVALVVLAPARP